MVIFQAYDKYIDQVTREISREEADLKQSKSVRPQIKQPADSKKLTNKKAGELSKTLISKAGYLEMFGTFGMF